MKISFAFAFASILSLAFMPRSECQFGSFGFDNLINKTLGWSHFLTFFYKTIMIIPSLDIIDVGEKTSTGIAGKMVDFMPTPMGILTMSKDTLMGLPIELLMTCIDQMCKHLMNLFCLQKLMFHLRLGSLALAANNSTKPYKQPKIEEMNYFLMTDHENISIPITDSKQLWNHPKFDKNKKVVVMVTGWNSDIKEESSAASALWTAYKTRNDTNFVLIDTARYIDTLYAYSAFNTMDLGVGLATGLAELMKIIPLERIHVMGHSLGYVAKFFIFVYLFCCF